MGAPGASLLGPGKARTQSIRRGCPANFNPALFLARTGRRRLAQPRWCLAGCPLIQPFPPFSKPQLMVPFAQLHRAKGGKARTSTHPRRCPANFNPAPFFWRGPAAGDWPHRGWCLAGCHSSNHFPLFQATTYGVLRAASSREGWESTNSTHPAQVSRQLQSRAFFWRGPAAGGWPHRRWFAENYLHLAHNGNGEETAQALKNPQKTSTPHPPMYFHHIFSPKNILIILL